MKKEIINKIKKCLIAGYDVDVINQEEMGILWNYITNLQEENERLEGLIELMYYKIQLNDEQQELLDSILQGEEK